MYTHYSFYRRLIFVEGRLAANEPVKFIELNGDDFEEVTHPSAKAHALVNEWNRKEAQYVIANGGGIRYFYFLD